MASDKTNLFLRNDTILGVCEGLGQDLGINPNILRVPLASGLIFAPLWVLGIYAALGAVVLASRLLIPDRARQTPAANTDVPAAIAAAPTEAVEAQDTRELAEAA